MTKQIKADICVIGGGSGGLSVAAGAAQMGANVVLLEGHKMGGDCLNYGCVPSKALIASARHAHAMKAGAPFGIAPCEPEVDFKAAKNHVSEVIKSIEPHDSKERFEKLGVKVIQEYGMFISPKTVRAGVTEISARRFVIATGSSPMVPPIPGLDEVTYYTNETIFELIEKPQHLLIIGGGPIGLEMAQAHRRLGCEVTVLEGARALQNDDPELAALVIENLRHEGIAIHEGAQVERVASEKNKIIVYPKGAEPLEGTHLLLAVGRQANTKYLNLEEAGIDTFRRGIKVDHSLKTSNRRVYAIGDVAGGFQFTHVAGYHAGIVVRSALFGLPAKARNDHIPWCTYTEPELAHVGQKERDALELHGSKLEVTRFSYEDNDRARADRATKGLIKVMVLGGRPIGASIVGAHAGELISTWAMAIANKQKMSAIANMVAAYPTYAEINKRAAGAYFGNKLFNSNSVKKIVRFVQYF